MNTSTHDEKWTAVKVVIAWIGTGFGSITLNNLVLGATLVFTILNIYSLIRRIRRERKEDERRELQDHEREL